MRFFTATLSMLLLATLPAAAQFNVNTTTEQQKPVVTSVNKNEPTSANIAIDYETAAKLKAERKAIRKERNKFTFTSSLTGTFNGLNDAYTQVKGGENNLAVSGRVFVNNVYKKNLFTLDTRFEANYGQTYQASDKWFKSTDNFSLKINPSWDWGKEGARKNWAYSAKAEFNSQFDCGYANRTDAKNGNLKSTFLSPAYLTAGVGIKFTSPEKKFPIKINFDVLSSSTTIVSDSTLRSYNYNATDGSITKVKNSYGMLVPKDATYRGSGRYYYSPIRFEGGSQISMEINVNLDRKGIVNYHSTLSSFYGWITDLTRLSQAEDKEAYEHIIPTFTWNNTFNIRLVKNLTCLLKCNMFYDRQQLNELQLTYMAQVGLSYTFNNK